MTDKDNSMSLISIINARSDTAYFGNEVRDVEYHKEFHPDKELIKDESGQYYTQPHDHLSFSVRNGRRVGVLVADEDGKNSFDHEKDHLPHLIGLFVRKEYRGEGIASQLVDEFMSEMGQDTCVVDCEHEVVPFYEQLNWNIIYGEALKSGVDIEQYNERLRTDPEDRDYSPTQDHYLPFFRNASDVTYYREECLHVGKPAVYLLETGSGPLCEITVQMPFLSDEKRRENVRLNDSGNEKVRRTLDTYSDRANFFSDREIKSDFFRFSPMLPQDARSLADELYPIITDKSNLEIRRSNLDFELSEIDSLNEKAIVLIVTNPFQMLMKKSRCVRIVERRMTKSLLET